MKENKDIISDTNEKNFSSGLFNIKIHEINKERLFNQLNNSKMFIDNYDKFFKVTKSFGQNNEEISDLYKSYHILDRLLVNYKNMHPINKEILQIRKDKKSYNLKQEQFVKSIDTFLQSSNIVNIKGSNSKSDFVNITNFRKYFEICEKKGVFSPDIISLSKTGSNYSEDDAITMVKLMVDLEKKAKTNRKRTFLEKEKNKENLDTKATTYPNIKSTKSTRNQIYSKKVKNILNTEESTKHINTDEINNTNISKQAKSINNKSKFIYHDIEKLNDFSQAKYISKLNNKSTEKIKIIKKLNCFFDSFDKQEKSAEEIMSQASYGLLNSKYKCLYLEDRKPKNPINLVSLSKKKLSEIFS